MKAVVITASVLLLGASFFAIRAQMGIGDKQFLRSMIPHHSAAILMCRQANISDPEIENLCRGIVESQQREITQMKTLLGR